MNEAARRLAHVEELFAAAKELPAPARPALLSRRCAGDAALMREVLLLLEQDARDGTLLDVPAEQRLGAGDADEESAAG